MQSLRDLLVHYTEGAVPRHAKVLALESSAALPRYISLLMESHEWEDTTDLGVGGELVPLHVRYEGGRVMKLENPQDAGVEAWGSPEAVEAPSRQ